MKRYKSVDAFIEGVDQFTQELQQLRKVLSGCELAEEVKWGAPCYTFDGKKVVGMGAFKSYFGLWFFQGALLSDPLGVLINAQEGKTKALRQWRMQSKKDIKARQIKAYVKEAILLQQQGKEIKPARNKPVVVPGELSNALKVDKKAQAAFDKLTKGRQREYADYITDAKRAETRLKRLDKILPMIREGVGLNDKYRSA